MGIKDEVKDAWDGVLSPLFDEFAAEVSVEILDTEATVVDDLYEEEEVTSVITDPLCDTYREFYKPNYEIDTLDI